MSEATNTGAANVNSNAVRKYPNEWLFARINAATGRAMQVGTWDAMSKPTDRTVGVRVSALPRSDAAWTAAYLIDKWNGQGDELREATLLKAASAALSAYKRGGGEASLGAALYCLAMVAELRRTNPNQ